MRGVAGPVAWRPGGRRAGQDTGVGREAGHARRQAHTTAARPGVTSRRVTSKRTASERMATASVVGSWERFK